LFGEKWHYGVELMLKFEEIVDFGDEGCVKWFI
jgi:hypothetical protein